MKKLKKTKCPDQFQIHLFHEGTMNRAFEMMGAHPGEEDGEKGVRFSVWAPHARSVSVIGGFNDWDGSRNPLERIDKSGVWTAFVKGVGNGELYKYEIISSQGDKLYKADPYAFFSEVRPCSASRVFDLLGYDWNDREWLNKRKKGSVYNEPLNIYEVHLGSWRLKDDGSFYTYREMADILVDYAADMGYTHLQLLPLGEHPFDGSWGYQTTGYYAITSRYGTPHDFMYFVDRCHQKGLGVILDWVAAHFCRDAHGLADFDGTPLYEGCEICGWGTFQFDFARPEVRNFLISNAVFLFEVYHIDGLRVDAVASMLYLNYGKEHGEWEPNIYGGNGNLGAISFLKYLNEVVFANFPRALMIAEESTEWPLVTGPTSSGGLGFNYKWNMGWMNDCLKYMEKDAIYRKWHHNLLTFSFFYAFSENFILPLSHDEVVHGKRSLIDKMPGDYWQKFANFRTFMGYMMAHPGKKLLFMGQEIAQFIEWRYYEGLEWHLLDFEMHRKFQRYIKDLNHVYLREKALWEIDHNWQGFSWIDCHNAQQSILIFSRQGKKQEDFLIAVCNFTPQYYESFRIGIPNNKIYQEIINSDAVIYGGSGKENSGLLRTEKIPWHNHPYSLEMKMPPLAFLLLKPIEEK